MARIRTIKPEFPQSESMGRVSRESRLLFIMLWTICDDYGKGRGNSRMLASLLFPYDDDAPIRIDGWLSELEKEGCVIRYVIDGTNYFKCCNWLKHQKIDKPTQSKIAEPDESSRILANPLESSLLDLGSKDQGIDQGKERKGRQSFVPPALHEVVEYCKERNKGVDANKWYDYYSANGWKVGRNPMKDWKAAVRTWEKNSFSPQQPETDKRKYL